MANGDDAHGTGAQSPATPTQAPAVGADGAPDDAETADDPHHGGCGDIDLSGSDVPDVAREDCQRVVTNMPNRDEVRRWPRYAIYHRAAGRRIRIYGRPRSQPNQELTVQGYLDYLRCVDRPNPQASDHMTWGDRHSLQVPVAHLQDGENQTRTLQYDRSAGHSRTFDVYNLTDLQPGWELLLKRTLMAFPIQWLEMLKIRIIFIDFVVGNSAMGIPQAWIDRGYQSHEVGGSASHVVSGGANWPFWMGGVDHGDASGLCITYTALNRPWESGYSGRDDASIDERYSAARLHTNVLGTLYHEAGHIFQWIWGRRSRIPESERGRNSRSTSDSALWNTYREQSGYTTASRPTEGFAEAFRRRMVGSPHPGGVQADIRERVDSALDALGVPTPASVVAAHRAIVRELGG